ncbi:MAG: LUD domain-containing protein [Thermoplasmata archaeon]
MSASSSPPKLNAVMPSATALAVNLEFGRLATDSQVARAVAALEFRGFDVIVAPTSSAAREAVLRLLPEKAEVFTSTSRTLESLGLPAEIEGSGRYNPIRPHLLQLRKEGKFSEMRKLGAAPDFVVGSVHAITEAGEVLVASGSGSQLAPYVYGAGKVIWVVGTQKIVSDQETALRRIGEYSFPLEDARAREAYGMGSSVSKVLLFNRDAPGRTTIVLVRENLGF